MDQTTTRDTVPVMRPLLPPLPAIAPYLTEIDRTRWYSNHGPLVQQLERRMAAALDAPPGGVVSVGNGTAGLAAALIALDLPKGSLIAVPSWTFCATAHAVALAGHVPYLVDVDPDTWTLTPARVSAVLNDGHARITAVMPVSPFGAPLDVDGWRAFRAETGLAVIVDAAAGFDTWTACDIPAVVSLHATKALGAGEGGLVVATDTALLDRIRPIVNFGFSGLAVAQAHAFNGKLSEYGAAVALAALDAWPDTRASWRDAAALYAPLLARNDLVTQAGFGQRWVGSVLVVRLPDHDARAVEAGLGTHGILTRRWWPLALHEHPAFAACPWDSTEHGGRLARQCLGLPFFRDIAPHQARTVMDALDRVLAAVTA
ncbi:aminotransferase class I/II-fold pyridoxal phosphate-dependent enzyme [Roseospira goensis]|uniref:dTDP-4-amino-4,6-dideoxygalactose transaminase n=1 Tax=Roseospira goensis TaxID=391922 RepID=A0A7W6S0H2_9PROT|nr:aminotransferase class I/II-fold pyridoxal phosphate-dependent enzyme [Roseospira goensis]MBB4286447.1 dTDP-4-amino-4,6-dideoxygalactose transaminase [Roseospira goensis]